MSAHDEVITTDKPVRALARRESLELRLDDGYRRIDEAAFAGTDVTEWETFWIRLLHEYEDVCRDLEAAA